MNGLSGRAWGEKKAEEKAGGRGGEKGPSLRASLTDSGAILD